MASSTLLFAAILFAAVALPVAQAQLLGIVNINGTVFCSIGTTTNTATIPFFQNALVQLQCAGNVISSTTTNANGVFTMSLNLLTSLVSTLLNGCKLVVNTPLSTCNASLPSVGVLQSVLQPIGGLLDGLSGGIINPTSQVFTLVQ